MKPEGRFRFFATLLAVLVGAVLVGIVVYATTYQTLRSAYRDLLEKSAAQATEVIEDFLGTQFTLLSLYATVPSVQGGRFSELPDWLQHPAEDSRSPKRLSIIDPLGEGLSSSGVRFSAGDRDYFRRALAGVRNVAGPLVSRIDGASTVVLAEPLGDPPAGVLTASIDLPAFRRLLDSVRGLDGTVFTLETVSGVVIAETGGPSAPRSTEVIATTRLLVRAPWTLTAQVAVDDVLEPVRAVLFVVGVLVVAGAGLVVLFFLMGRRHRLDLDQVREDRTQALRDAYEQIRKLAYHDIVTRLPNRNLALRKLAEALQDRREHRVLAVALARFRSLTTTFGMNFGDALLKEASRRLQSVAAEGEPGFLGRLGGSEFLLILDASVHSSAVMDRILALFQEPMGPEGLKLHVGIHVGGCLLSEAGDTPEEVIKSVETALWAARERGPNEASELTAEAVAQRSRRAQLQKLLPEALDRGEFEVHYQPQIDLKTGAVSGYEALARWTSPELGAVGPAEFIPVAEETGFIVTLGFWILDQGIAFARELEARGHPVPVSINVSPVQLLQHDFLEAVGRRVAASGLSPRSLGLEITESTLMEGIDAIRPALGRVMSSGIQVGLDDFGTGYSSLNYLKDLPLHTLKIDKGFIDALEHDPKAFRLTATIIELAHHLDLVVVAEGIESDAQRDLLASVGCDRVQGFLTGRPRRAQDHLEDLGR